MKLIATCSDERDPAQRWTDSCSGVCHKTRQIKLHWIYIINLIIGYILLWVYIRDVGCRETARRLSTPCHLISQYIYYSRETGWDKSVSEMSCRVGRKTSIQSVTQSLCTTVEVVYKAGIPREQFPRSILVRHARHARFRRDIRGRYEETASVKFQFNTAIKNSPEEP